MVGLEADECERKRKEGRKQKGVERSGRRDEVKGRRVKNGGEWQEGGKTGCGTKQIRVN